MSAEVAFNSETYEKLGLFYLGTQHQASQGQATQTKAPYLYESKKLTTHGVIVGMTGSGKTGLGITLLEEALIDNIPVIAIDPKGDLSNMLLQFPNMSKEDFAPWCAEGEDAEALAASWSSGLLNSGQDVGRIKRLMDACEMNVYTPGSDAGVQLSVLAALTHSSDTVDSQSERASSFATSLLTFAGFKEEALEQSPEYVLVYQVLLHAYAGTSELTPNSLSLETLLRNIQTPPFSNIGVMDVESVVNTKARTALVVKLNTLFASPSFTKLSAGVGLDIQRLFCSPKGKPRLSVISIAHLSEDERMLVVSTVLTELLAWMRKQSGTQNLRAILYMDEVFGYLPPVANPPSKGPLITLLKQARAFGLGVTLSTQNPVDLDYKALSNAGTWCIGRLQTEQDKARIMDGLKHVSGGVDPKQIAESISHLQKREFLIQVAGSGAPETFYTRQCLSYLRGPMTLHDIKSLKQTKPDHGTIAASALTHETTLQSTAGEPAKTRPVFSGNITERFVSLPNVPEKTRYQPGFAYKTRLHYVEAKSKLDTWVDQTFVAPLGPEGPRFAEAIVVTGGGLAEAPTAGKTFMPLPVPLNEKIFASWSKQVPSALLQHAVLRLLYCPEVNVMASVGESRDQFAQRVFDFARIKKEEAIQELKTKLEPKLLRAEKAWKTAQERSHVADEKKSTGNMNQGIEIGASILGTVFGRGSVWGGAKRVAQKAAQQKKIAADAVRADEKEALAQKEYEALHKDAEQQLQAVASTYDPAKFTLQEKSFAPRKSDVLVSETSLLWVVG